MGKEEEFLMNQRIEEDKANADKKRAEESAPLMDFSKTEEGSDDYEKRLASVKAYFRTQIVGKISEFLFGVFCIFMTVYTGPIGTILFLAAIFYLIPDGLIKGIVFINHYIHAKDYVLAKDYHIDKHYIQIVLNRFSLKRKSDD